MFTSIEEFKMTWGQHSDATAKIFGALTDASLKQKVADGHRDLGRVAWHLIQSIPEMSNRTGLSVSGPGLEEPVKYSASEMLSLYKKSAKTLADEITSKWKDDTLVVEDDMYGMKWKRGLTLQILIDHEVHHRGQMTVLMRQAGLKVPGVFGPAKEEWDQYGAPAPEI